MQAKSAAKMKQIVDLANLLQVKIEARQKLDPQTGIIELVPYYIDMEQYPQDPPAPPVPPKGFRVPPTKRLPGKPVPPEELREILEEGDGEDGGDGKEPDAAPSA
jgi:hypothetical protein